MRDLNHKEHQQLQSNQPVVVDDTSAFSADVLKGDIALTIHEAPEHGTNGMGKNAERKQQLRDHRCSDAARGWKKTLQTSEALQEQGA
ncbi:hypothetical protein ACFQ2A_21720 [Variovorax dokdonensis]